VHLTTYRPASYVGFELGTSEIYVEARADQTMRYETYVPRPLDRVDTVDVSLAPQWPKFEGVPVVWDR
jgi:hypothetical protein